MPKLNRKNKQLVFSFIFFLVSVAGLLVANYLVKRQTRFDSQASETLTPLIIPGSLLDTGIDAFAFEDVDQNDWAFKYIQQISPLGIIPPKTPTQFDPKGLVPRKDMAVFMLRTYEILSGETAPLVDTPFTDIADLPQETQDAIAKIYGLKITAGTTDTTFSPDWEVDRAQMVTFFMNMYRALTGDYPPEAEVPFTDLEDDPSYNWSIKYIKKAYNYKITAGLTETTFGPTVKTTREQMATFIFNFMRLFGSSWNDPNFKTELADIKSVMFNREYNNIPHHLYQYDIRLSESIQHIKQTGYNTVRLLVPWKEIDYSPLTKPDQYSSTNLQIILNSLELLKQNGMKAIININEFGEGWSPSGIDHCTWTVNLDQYLAFEEYVKDFLTLIEDYADITYIQLSTENSEPCQLDSYHDAKQIAAVLRPTIGSLPQRLPQELRNKFKIGYHDYTLLTYNWTNRESPIQMPFSYDFYSNALYNHEGKTDQEIIEAINQPINNLKAIYPFTPLFFGEYGASYCNYKPSPTSDTINSTNETQARILKTAISHFIDQEIGFNIWQWQGQFRNTDNCPTTNSDLPHPNGFGLAYLDAAYYAQPILISKPAHVEITRLLNSSAPEPSCQENPTFGQKRIDEQTQQCRQFYSSCLPEGFAKQDNISDCVELCSDQLVWVRTDVRLDGLCSHIPYPVNCIPELHYPDPTCDPNYQSGSSSSTSSPTPTPDTLSTPAQINPSQTQTLQAPTTTTQLTTDPSPDLFPVVTETAEEIVSTPQSLPDDATPVEIPSVDATESTETGIVGFMDRAIEFVLDLVTP